MKEITANITDFIKKNYLILGLLFFLIFIVYINSLGNGFVSDDLGFLVKRNFSERVDIIFADPLSIFANLVSGIAVSACGPVPWCIRLPNLLLHLSNTWLLFITIGLLANRKTAIFSAVLFAVHPLLTEGVVWISSLGYLLYTFFFLLSLICYIKGSKKKGLSKYYYLSLFFTLLAFITVRRVFGFPLIIAYEIIFGNIRENWKRLIPFGLLSLIWFPLQLVNIGDQAQQNIVSNGGAMAKVSLLIQIPLAITTYLNLFIFPKDLTFYHSLVFIGTKELVTRWIVLILTLGLGLYFFRKKKLLLFALVFFLFSILLYNNPFGTNWVVAERYVYFASIGLVIIAGFFFAQFAKEKSLYYPTIIIFSILILLLSIRTIVRNMDWKNEDSLFVSVAKVVPNDPRALNKEGNLAYQSGDLEKAKGFYLQGIKSNPGFAESYFNLGNYYKDNNQMDVAENYYQKALSLDPTHWETLQNLAILTYQKKDVEKAITYINEAIKYNPRNSSLYNNLGIIYLSLGRKEEAKSAFTKAVAVDPNNESAVAGLKQANQ